MNDEIFHRGPDDSGIYYFEDFEVKLGLSMRSSIIDIEGGHQPIISNCGNYSIVFNGEIYNYKELKDRIQSKGLKFKTNSDTEVIPNLYIHDGISGLRYLDGMFSIGIIDKRLKNFPARDLFGENYCTTSISNDGIIWSSEIKALKKSIPKLSLNEEDAIVFSDELCSIASTIYNEIKNSNLTQYLNLIIRIFLSNLMKYGMRTILSPQHINH